MNQEGGWRQESRDPQGRPPEAELEAAAAEGVRRKNIQYPDGQYPSAYKTSQQVPGPTQDQWRSRSQIARRLTEWEKK